MSHLKCLQYIYLGLLILRKLTKWRHFITYLWNNTHIINCSSYLCAPFPKFSENLAITYLVLLLTDTETNSTENQHVTLHGLNSSLNWLTILHTMLAIHSMENLVQFLSHYLQSVYIICIHFFCLAIPAYISYMSLIQPGLPWFLMQTFSYIEVWPFLRYVKALKNCWSCGELWLYVMCVCVCVLDQFSELTIKSMSSLLILTRDNSVSFNCFSVASSIWRSLTTFIACKTDNDHYGHLSNITSPPYRMRTGKHGMCALTAVKLSKTE